MPEATHNYTKLPGRLRNELGITVGRGRGSRDICNGASTRKSQRKAARLEKKRIPPKTPAVRVSQDSQHAVAKQGTGRRQTSPSLQTPKPVPKSILKIPKTHPIDSPSRSSEPHLSRRERERLEEDDNEIVALEKALGLKDRTKLPKSFEDDGLDGLLEGLDGATKNISSGKRTLDESEQWLKKKRQKSIAYQDVSKVKALNDAAEDGTSNEPSESNENPDESMSEQDQVEETDSDMSAHSWDSLGSDDEAASMGTGNGVLSSSPPPTRSRRENPYIAPVDQSDAALQTKYIPPSVRSKDISITDGGTRMRKQLQGLLNRLSEANLLSIVAEIEKIYQNNPRQHVSAGILDLLLGLLADPSILQDTFIILHAGLIAAIYKVVGTEFGAQAIERIEKVFFEIYNRHNHSDIVDKRLMNLVNTLAELYNFQVIGGAFMFDLIHVFLRTLSETNTELLLKVVRNAGTQLRQDDAESLKSIASMLQTQINRAGEGSMSIRLRFMLETINHLKNRKMKTGIAASTISIEHTIRMKKTLGTLNQRSLIVSEPLRFNLKDLQDTDKRGKWWLVGGTFKNDEQDLTLEKAPKYRDKHNMEELDLEPHSIGDLASLAKTQRMNTDVRRSIFIAIMSATDYNDAYVRLIKLRLKKSQELEIPKVLIHCAGAETSYNPFYTLLSRRVCSDRKLKMAFQFSLWDIFKQMTDTEDAQDGVDDNDAPGDGVSLRKTVNLARMFGGLIADGGLTLDVLKNLNFAYLQKTMQTFVEILLISVILQSQGTIDGPRNERSLLEVFERPKEMPAMARSMKYFLRKVVGKSDLAGSQKNTDCVRIDIDAATAEATFDVVIVGAGLQGLAAAKTFLEINPSLRLRIFDANNTIGGVWAEEHLYTGLRTNNLLGMYEYSDFPMSKDLGAKTGDHIPGTTVYQYLCNYATEFDLISRIKLSTKVISAEHKHQLGWLLRVCPAPQGHATYITCTKLVLATGLTSTPNPVPFVTPPSFTPKVYGFHDLPKVEDELCHNPAITHVTVYGGGKAAHDTVYLLSSAGKRVTMVIRASGHGATYMAAPYLRIGVFGRFWLETMATCRPLLWLSPCIWGAADGFGATRMLLHATRLGRAFVSLAWKWMTSNILRESGVKKSPLTKDLVPDQNVLWYATQVAILNYPTDIYDRVRKGQVKILRADVDGFSGRNLVTLKDGKSIRTDALVCCMGWKHAPSLKFLPKAIHADLGVPSTEYTHTQHDLWKDLDARADEEILRRLPMLLQGPGLHKGSSSEQESTSWRLWRGIAPPSHPSHDIVFLGMALHFQTAMRAEISSLWAYAYLYDQLVHPIASMAEPPRSIHLHKEDDFRYETSDKASEHSEKPYDVNEEQLYDTALFCRFSRWRAPYGFGARHPDLFDGLPYLDMLLTDLGLRTWRKGWGLLGEVFGGGYTMKHYRGLVDEWIALQAGR